MQLAIYQVDAFAEQAFEGNPAAVIPLDYWLPDATLQAIAEENNLAETAFVLFEADSVAIRWFTPNCEVKLCGHATLAAAYVLFHYLNYAGEQIRFQSLSGELVVSRHGERFSLDFPVQPLQPCDAPEPLCLGLGVSPSQCFVGEDFLVVLDSEQQLASLQPQHDYLRQLPQRGVIVTAPAEDYDFVLRFFAPKAAIDEDSVTGSAFTQLAPYWASVLAKHTLSAKQISTRGGKVYCELRDQRVLISGCAVPYLSGHIVIDQRWL